MSKYIFYDLETSGRGKKEYPNAFGTTPKWEQIMQIAAIVTDSNFNQTNQNMNEFCRPRTSIISQPGALITTLKGMREALDAPQSSYELMKKINDTPIIFALSNPTANSECTAKDVLLNTKGKAIFSSGSPFKPIINGEKEFHTSQANNAYVFPGIGLGVLLSKVDIITVDIFLNAAHTLSKITSDNDLKNGKIYPSINQIRRTSIKIAYSIASTYNKKITYKDIDNEIYYPNYK